MSVLISFQNPGSPQDDDGNAVWTPLFTNLVNLAKQVPGNEITLDHLDGRDFQNPPSEIDQIIKAIQRGYGLPYWTCAGLLMKWLIAYRNKGVARGGDRLIGDATLDQRTV